MAFTGQIESDQRVDRDAWIALIASHPSLSNPPSRKGINPFTQEPVTFTPPPDSAILTINGKVLGHIGWAQDDSPMLVVEADTVDAERLVEELAENLGGRFMKNGELE